MKKLLLALCLSTAVITTGLAESNLSRIFFNEMIGRNITDRGAWGIWGRTGDNRVNAACGMGTSWNDGSYFNFIKDLMDQEVYMEMHNANWNISDAPGTYELRANFVYSNGHVVGGSLKYQLINKNKILIRNLDRSIIDLVFDAKGLVLVMPGSIQSVTIPLDNSRSGMKLLSKCIDVSKNYSLTGPDSRPGTNI